MKLVNTLSHISRLVDESLPNITGRSYLLGATWTSSGTIGAITTILTSTNVQSNTGSSYSTYITFNANNSTSTYQDNAHVTPLSITTAFLIKH